jgi:hypothetical protein
MQVQMNSELGNQLGDYDKRVAKPGAAESVDGGVLWMTRSSATSNSSK